MNRNESTRSRGRRYRFDDNAAEEYDYSTALADFRRDSRRAGAPDDDRADGGVGGPPEGDRWSTWEASERGQRGPEPYPAWIVTDREAVDRELGIVKTGKEADVHLIERYLPGTDRSCLLAAKRYRATTHRMFRRDDAYTSGRVDAESRVNRAIAKRSSFGQRVIANKWVEAEFSALKSLYVSGVAVPYPVQVIGSEILMEFMGEEDGTAAPRLVILRPEPDVLVDLWDQLRHNMSLLAVAGYAHGDLSPYNLLVHDGRLIVIDVPQIVDVVANPLGRDFLLRDVRNVGDWFVSRGLAPSEVDRLAEDVLRDARLV